MQERSLSYIARIKTDFPTKFGIPRQSGLVKDLKAIIQFEEGFRNPDAVRGLSEFSHIWLIWEFSGAVRESWSPTVRPPRLGGNERIGVFATRSPFRPNPIGLSSVKLDKVELHPTLGPLLHVSGADLMDGTPIFDIKPYLPYGDCHPDATGGFTDTREKKILSVTAPNEIMAALPEQLHSSLLGTLAQDPRPPYQKDPHRVYVLPFSTFEVRFSVDGDALTILSIDPA